MGKEPSKLKYHGGTIFVDHASSFIFLVNQCSLRVGSLRLPSNVLLEHAHTKLNPSVLTKCHLHRRSSKLICLPKVKRLLFQESEHIIRMGLQKEPFRRLPSGLQRAGLSSSRLPTLKQVLDCRSVSQGRSRSRSATKSRAAFFCLGFSKFWKTPIHVILRRLRNKHNLLWLRVSMSYHRLNNLRELFQGHLN
jgi:hypothetical protein